jgi:L-alanine-DL-glutamate epimerase-like enolase superfamily enzyme
MKITDLTLTMFKWDVPSGIRTGSLQSPAYGKGELALVTISTDEGVTGHSFMGSASRRASVEAPALIAYLKPAVMGQNPLDTGRLWQRMWLNNRQASLRCIGAVDVALWDLVGQYLKQPIHRLLGTCRDRVPAYASSEYLPTPQDYVNEALEFKEKGWTAYKIHPHSNAKEDIEICYAVRKAVGDKYTLMLDSVWAYDYAGALRVGKVCEELDFLCYEDPLPEDDIYNYVKLRQKLNIPILATEYTPGGAYGLPEFIIRGATDILRGDVTVKAGITSLVKIAHTADTFRMKCEIHHGGNSLANAANLNVTMAINNCDWFEVLLPDIAQKYGLVKDIEVDKQGYVYAPTAPGLGFEIDWDLVKRNTIQVMK